MKLVLLVLLVSGSAIAKEPLWVWNQPKPYEAAVLGAAISLIWVDVLQTRDARQRYPLSLETNPMLGPRPTQGRVFWVGGVLSTLALTAVWYALPTAWRIVPCGGVIGGEGYAVAQNVDQGFKIRF